ncbi:hypothetical protein ACFL0Z_01410 [Patescibacteria group bacterium]
MSNPGAHCGVCRCLTSYAVDSTGTLCKRHKRSFDRKKQIISDWAGDETHRVNSEIGCLERNRLYDKFRLRKKHAQTQGRYRFRCDGCRGHFWSDELHDGGLCPHCSRRLTELQEKMSNIWIAFQKNFRKKMRVLCRRYNQDAEMWNKDDIPSRHGWNLENS